MKMLNRLLASILILGAAVLALGPAQAIAAESHRSAAGGHFGLGVVLGEPTGLSAKYRITSRDAVDFGLAYSFNDFFAIFSDYLFHFPGVIPRPSGSASGATFVSELTPYVGIGAIAFFNTASARNDRKFFTGDGSSAGLGLRIPLGIEWRPHYPPLGIFLELVPGVGIVPSTFGFFEAGIGARFYF
jgi:hypothetical protein